MPPPKNDKKDNAARPTPQVNPIMQLSQAINNLNVRIANLEITVQKLTATGEIFEKEINLLHHTIELIEKKIRID